MIGMYLDSIHCDEGTTELGADEPYVLVTVVDLAATVSVAGFPVPLPAFEVVRIGPFQNFTKGKTQPAHFTPNLLPSFWGVKGIPAPLTDPDLAIFIVSLMENDDGDAEALRGIVKGIVGGSVLGSLSADRATKIAALIQDVNSAAGTPTGAPNFDDRIGTPQELRFSAADLSEAASGATVGQTLAFEGDGGRYTLTFQARTFEKRLRRFLTARQFGNTVRSLQPRVASIRTLMQV